MKNGQAVTKNGAIGVVVDGDVKKTGPNKGKIEVMWIGGRYTVAEVPADLVAIKVVAA